MRNIVEGPALATPRLPEWHVPTPALLVDLDVFDANVAAMNALLAGTSKRLRPHVKTHRTPELALRQLGGSVRGVTCATVGEAEAMVAKLAERMARDTVHLNEEKHKRENIEGQDEIPDPREVRGASARLGDRS